MNINENYILFPIIFYYIYYCYNTHIAVISLILKIKNYTFRWIPVIVITVRNDFCLSGNSNHLPANNIEKTQNNTIIYHIKIRKSHEINAKQLTTKEREIMAQPIPHMNTNIQSNPLCMVLLKKRRNPRQGNLSFSNRAKFTFLLRRMRLIYTPQTAYTTVKPTVAFL